MQGHYGSRFLNMWKTNQTLEDGRDAGIVNAMEFWGMKLTPYLNRPAVIQHVLDQLPAEPPNLPEFVRLCSRAVDATNVPRLEKQWTQEELEKNKQRAMEALRRLKL